MPSSVCVAKKGVEECAGQLEVLQEAEKTNRNGAVVVEDTVEIT